MRIIPSIPRGLLLPPEKSRSERLNLVSWSTASFPARASPTNRILSGLLTVTSCSRNVRIERFAGEDETHFGEGSHERLVILHSTSRIDQNDIERILLA